jgi:hypothetical protein
MRSGGGEHDAPPPAEGVLIRAENGDVITFDATGLTLRLSETVLADLRARLGLGALADPAAALGDIDAWNLRRAGDYHLFTARLDPALGPRDYLKPVAGGDVIAAAPGPLLGLLGFGGARRAGFNPGRPAFPHHVLAPGDDVGGVGLEATARAEPTAALQNLRVSTRESLIADRLLAARLAAGQALPLHFVRAETSEAHRTAELAEGTGYANLLAAADSLVRAAASLGKTPKLLAVGLDWGLEDTASDAETHLAALRALLARIEADMARRALRAPPFLMIFESGTERVSDAPAIRAQWRLAWDAAPHRVIFAAPGYAFPQAGFGRPTEAARAAMAEIEALALAAHLARAPWACPLPLLAEAEGARIRVTLAAMGPLVLDPADPLGAGPAAGFRVTDRTGEVPVTAAVIDPADDRAVIVTCARPPGEGAELAYAVGHPPADDGYPANRGALREDWEAEGATALPKTGRKLHRWALPAVLPVHPRTGR